MISTFFTPPKEITESQNNLIKKEWFHVDPLLTTVILITASVCVAAINLPQELTPGGSMIGK